VKEVLFRAESDKTFYYKLFKIESTSDTSIKAVMAETAFNEIQNLKKEATIPDFSFKDLNGNLITNESMKENCGHKMLVFIVCCFALRNFRGQ
jgi:hypothetical protein